jgi:hypothetical protein
MRGTSNGGWVGATTERTTMNLLAPRWIGPRAGPASPGVELRGRSGHGRASDVVAAAIALFGLACGGTGPGGSGGGAVPFESFEAARIAALCENLARCGWRATKESCILATDYPLSSDLRVSVGAGRNSYDPGASYRCLEKIRTLPCDHNGPAPDTSCEGETFVGAVAAGGVCHWDRECVSLSCRFPVCDGMCCTGTCDDGPARRSVPVGASCLDDIYCVAGAFCSVARRSTCAPLGEIGDPCGNGEDCRPELACGTDPAGGLACQRFVAPGGSCATSWCGLDEGALLVYCDDARICRVVYFVGPGGSCGGADGGRCSEGTYCLDGVCRLRAKLGDPCQLTLAAGLDEPCDQGFLSSTRVECREGQCVRDPPPAPPPPCEFP